MQPLAERPILELDEIWSFVGSKGEQVWIWIALERQTRRVVGLAFGDRTSDTCRKLWESLPPSYRKRAICYSDFWEPYAKVLPSKRHRPVGKEAGETAHIERRVTPYANGVPIWCAEPCHLVKISIGMNCTSACSLITTIVNWSALAILPQFRLGHYPRTNAADYGSECRPVVQLPSQTP